MNLSINRLALAIRKPKLEIDARHVFRNPSLALWLGVSVITIHLMLLPWVDRTWRATGDEPHYLLAAHSLVVDRDFDLTNNYDQFDYLNFYFSQDIAPQIRLNQQGQQILDHQLALPLLIAPAYALGGRLGVLLFQALIGGLLAAVTFRLAVSISGDQKASLVATLFIVLSPPLFLYHYLVYPELIGAWLTTAIVYKAVGQDKPVSHSAVVIFFALALLPWLNRRFVILALALAILVVWAWRDRERRPLTGIIFGQGWPGLVMAMLSIGLLLWFNSGLLAAERVDITLPTEGGMLWSRLIRGSGWLVDQQRGLLIYAPVYIGAIFGLPYVFNKSRRWFVIAPFIVSLVVTALAGGFWIAWEVGPRYLVVALPALASLLALAWHYYGRSIIGGGALSLLFMISLVNSWLIVANFELPYKSSLPLFYSRALSLSLIDYLPDMGQHIEILAEAGNAGGADVVIEEAGPVWFAATGRPVNLAQTEPLRDLPFGHYRLTWQLRTDANLPPETEILRLSVQTLGGGQLFSQIITAADLPTDGSYGEVTYAFLNTNVDRWRTPLLLHALSPGQGNVWVKGVSFRPVPLFAWILPGVYIGLFVLAAYLAWRWFKRPAVGASQASGKRIFPGYRLWRGDDLATPKHEHAPATLNDRDSSVARTLGTYSPGLSGRIIGWSLLFLLPLFALGYLVVRQVQPSRTYDAADFFHFAGRPVSDAEAVDGRAWLVDPLADPPQKAIYGPFDFFEPGQYQVSFRLKSVQAIEPEQEAARLRVSATANFAELMTQPLLGSHFSEPNLYHLFVLTIDNPRRQALSFEVDYTGQVALVIDEVIVKKVAGRSR